MQIEEIFQQTLSGGKLTITFGPLKFESSTYGNAIALIKIFTQKPDEKFEVSFNSALKIDDLGSLKMAFHGLTSVKELIQKYEQFQQIYDKISFIDVKKNYSNIENWSRSIISEFDDIAANFCIGKPKF